MRGLIANWLTPIPRVNREANNCLGPTIQERLDGDKKNDLLQWFIESVPLHERNVANLIWRIIRINFAATHTTSMVISNLPRNESDILTRLSLGLCLTSQCILRRFKNPSGRKFWKHSREKVLPSQPWTVFLCSIHSCEKHIESTVLEQVCLWFDRNEMVLTPSVSFNKPHGNARLRIPRRDVYPEGKNRFRPVWRCTLRLHTLSGSFHIRSFPLRHRYQVTRTNTR